MTPMSNPDPLKSSSSPCYFFVVLEIDFETQESHETLTDK